MTLNAAKLTDAAAAVTRMTQAVEASTAGRVGMATLNNAGAVALTQPLIMAGAQADHYDYTFGQAAQNVLFGGLVGGAFHGLGELIGAGLGHAPGETESGGPVTWDALQDGSTARGMVRAGVASMDSTHSLSPDAAQDMLAASRPQVISDLADQLGRAPTEDEIGALVERRSQEFMDNKAAGKYDPAIEPLEPIDLSHATPDAIQQAVDQGDYATAAKLEEQHAQGLEQDPAFRLSDDDKAEANKPVEELSTIQNLMQDFTACVAQEAE